MKSKDELITIQQASEIENKHETTFRRLCRLNKIKGAKKFGKTWVFPRSSLKKIDVTLWKKHEQ